MQFAWIKTISRFNRYRRADIARLPRETLDRRYPVIRAEYERTIKTKHLRPGWVYDGFTKDWTLPEKKITPDQQMMDDIGQAWGKLEQKQRKMMRQEFERQSGI